MSTLGELSQRRIEIKERLESDYLLKVSLNERDYRSCSSAKTILDLHKELEDIDNTIHWIEQKADIYDYELRGGYGNQIIFSNLSSELQETIEKINLLSLDSSMMSKKALDDNYQKLNSIQENSLCHSREIKMREYLNENKSSCNNIEKAVHEVKILEPVIERSPIKEYQEMFKLSIKETIIQKVILFLLNYADGEKHDMLAERLVKNIKWEEEEF